MIIQTWIFTTQVEELFYILNHNFLSSEQENTVKNSISSLIKITGILKKDDSQFFRSFSVSGINLHVFYYDQYIVAISLYSNEKSFIFKPFVRKVVELLDSFNFENNQYSLNVNLHFRRQYLELVHNTENDLFNTKTIKGEAMRNYIMKNKEKRVDKKGKYLVFGLGSSGKSSIVAQTFENWSINELEEIKPTVLQNLHNYTDDLLKETITILDLGGQDIYRKKHLENKGLFVGVKTLIYVIDLIKPNLEKNLDFFKKIIQNLIFNHEKPIISLFFHKYDPSNKIGLFMNLESTLSAFMELISKELFKDFEIDYYITSIYDSTAKDALIRTMFYTLPISFLTRTIQNNLVIKAANSLYPILNDFDRISNITDINLIENELYTNSIPFGYEIAKVTVNDWMKYLVSKDESFKNKINQELFIDIEIETTSKDVIVCLKCPLPEKLKQFPSICEITHGIFQGLGNYLGYSNTKLIQSEIRNKTEICKLKIS